MLSGWLGDALALPLADPASTLFWAVLSPFLLMAFARASHVTLSHKKKGATRSLASSGPCDASQFLLLDASMIFCRTSSVSGSS